ncbi:lamin tail domain-containing protein [Actinoplanes sp. NPDC023714]|uniref:lamin tail domain-containing protein n=1 Tax=Actinoplanes sp. NPDC023714 TaxID=3154322 RepID=UPI0033FD18F0
MKLLTATILTAIVAPMTPAHAATTPVPRLDVAQYDAPGTDTRAADSLNAEWISLVNDGGKPVSVTGWSIREQGGRVYTFGAVTIAAKGRLWLHTGRGADTGEHRYWNSGNHLWNNTGDEATLRDPAGRVTDTCAWTRQANRTRVAC